MIFFRFNGIKTTCNHGECVEGNNAATIHTENFCLCEIGWSGPNCDQPVCYWQCDQFGGTCENPNECICALDQSSICQNPPPTATQPPTAIAAPCDPLCNCEDQSIIGSSNDLDGHLLRGNQDQILNEDR